MVRCSLAAAVLAPVQPGHPAHLPHHPVRSRAAASSAGIDSSSTRLSVAVHRGQPVSRAPACSQTASRPSSDGPRTADILRVWRRRDRHSHGRAAFIVPSPGNPRHEELRARPSVDGGPDRHTPCARRSLSSGSGSSSPTAPAHPPEFPPADRAAGFPDWWTLLALRDIPSDARPGIFRPGVSLTAIPLLTYGRHGDRLRAGMLTGTFRSVRISRAFRARVLKTPPGRLRNRLRDPRGSSF